MAAETKAEKWIRYLATNLAERRNLEVDEALAIAKNDTAKADQHINKQRGLKHKKRMAQLAPRRKFKAQYKTYGAPLQGGAPGLGRRK
jgi:hypothetical protein